eukprot:5666247-Prymnesium_polylepis.1
MGEREVCMDGTGRARSQLRPRVGMLTRTGRNLPSTTSELVPLASHTVDGVRTHDDYPWETNPQHTHQNLQSPRHASPPQPRCSSRLDCHAYACAGIGAVCAATIRNARSMPVRQDQGTLLLCCELVVHEGVDFYVAFIEVVRLARWRARACAAAQLPAAPAGIGKPAVEAVHRPEEED